MPVSSTLVIPPNEETATEQEEERMLVTEGSQRVETIPGKSAIESAEENLLDKCEKAGKAEAQGENTEGNERLDKCDEGVVPENEPVSSQQASKDPVEEQPNSDIGVVSSASDRDFGEASPKTSRDLEYEKIGGEIRFGRHPNPSYQGWDNLRWMSYAGIRKVQYYEKVSRFVAGQKILFWSGDQYVERKLAIYDEPDLILILRPPTSLAEIRELLDLPIGAKIEDPDNAYKTIHVVESVVDPSTCKLRVSPLTTVTSVLLDVPAEDGRRRSCFELVTPAENILVSAVRLRSGADRILTSFTDSGAFLETSRAEHALKKSICKAHVSRHNLGSNSDLSWKHQIILGTLHSFVVIGNQSYLDSAIDAALFKQKETIPEEESNGYLDPRIIDEVDENGRTPLHYACWSRASNAIERLVRAGANVNLRTDPHNMTPSHVCAINLDDRGLSAILAVNRRPNVIDDLDRTPMYLAITEGRMVGGKPSPNMLDKCLAVLVSYGGEVGSKQYRHPLSQLAAAWRLEELAVALPHLNFRYPLTTSDESDKSQIGISLSAMYHYPVHSALITLRKKIKAACNGEQVQQLWAECAEPENKLVRCVKVSLMTPSWRSISNVA